MCCCSVVVLNAVLWVLLLLCCGETSSEERRESSLFIPCTVLYCSYGVQCVFVLRFCVSLCSVIRVIDVIPCAITCYIFCLFVIVSSL